MIETWSFRYNFTMRAARKELIGCHDCGEGVSFSAVSCPRCGSLEPRGPYIHSKRELRRHRTEDRNDHNLMISVLACGLLGVAFGALTAPSGLWTIFAASGYGALGVLLGVPVAFVINVTRHLGR